MQKEWTSYRITLLLYFVVLLLPFSFYFIYTAFQTMQQDTHIVRKSSWVTGAMEHLNADPHQQEKAEIDKSLNQISLWVQQNNASDLYIGQATLAEDFEEVNACWSTYQKQGNIQCYDLSNSLAVVIEKMVYLKQKKIINIFYMSLSFAMIFILLTIYLIRVYILIQMKKHAIHDHETKLFNKKYFLSELKTSCSRSARHNHPLSMLSIVIDNFETKSYDKKTKAHILKVLGGLITSLTRTSDVACRYDEDHISILLTDTEEENALFLEGRIREALEKHDFGVSPQLSFKFAAAHFDFEETPKAFVSRTQGLLK